MPCEILFLLMLVVFILFLGFWFLLIHCHDPSDKNRSITFGVLFLFLLIWVLISASFPLKKDFETTCDIKMIELPDDTKTQMFAYENKNYSIIDMFHKIVDESKWQIRCTTYEKMYFGIKWDVKDSMILEKRYQPPQKKE